MAMAILAAQEILAQDGLTNQEQVLAARIGQALAKVTGIDGLGVELRSGRGASCWLLGEAPPDPNTICSHFPVDRDGAAELLVYSALSELPMRRLLDATIRSILETLEVERREELLLEELGTNWESLEALYEISTDVLRFGNLKDALQRLIDRFTSLQEGLGAVLFAEREGMLEPLASSGACPERLHWADLGEMAKPIRESRPIVINDRPSVKTTADFCWAAATRLAAAPVTSRESVIGVLIVWREDLRREFDSPFSRLMEAITHQASMLLESDRLHRTVLENERLAQEIEIASSIQQTLLLGNPPANLPGFEIAAFSVASQQIDGDFHDFLQHPDGSLDVLIGDVMGKGVAAALLGAATKSQFLRSLSNLALASKGEPPQAVDIVRRAAGRLGERLISLDRFVTLLYARFDADRRRVSFVDCGHTGIVLHRKMTGETTFLRGDDLPLGVELECRCEQHAFDVMPGDTLLLYSDGVTETRNPAGEFFGEDRLVEAVENFSALGPELLVEQIRRQAAQFGAREKFSDDFTCIAARIRLTPETKPLSFLCSQYVFDLGQLAQAREWFRTCACAVPGGGLDEGSAFQLELVCTEAFVNTVIHGKRTGSSPPIRLKALFFEDHVTIEMRHQGPPFDPLSVPPPAFDGSKDSGFGTYIILRSADEVCYSREEPATNMISISISRKKK